MKVLGSVSRALIIEAIAVAAILLMVNRVAGLDGLNVASRSTVAAVERASDNDQRTSEVQSTLERFATQLRLGANQLVDETLATWFNK